jgi:hypothetical protein
MRVRLVRRPGQHGTSKYTEQYGDRLICVRYRYDAAAGRRYKTIEIIVDEAPWAPPLQGEAAKGESGDPGQRRAPQSEPVPAAEAADGPRAGPQLERPVTGGKPRHRLAPSTLVGVRPPAAAGGVVSRLAQAGGIRRELLDVWVVSYQLALDLGLSQYIVDTLENLVSVWNRRSSTGSRRK